MKKKIGTKKSWYKKKLDTKLIGNCRRIDTSNLLPTITGCRAPYAGWTGLAHSVTPPETKQKGGTQKANRGATVVPTLHHFYCG
jgi:hypothetical protein